MKTVDYNMLTRIQEKIWKVAHGGLLGLFSGSWNGEAGTVPSVSFCMELERAVFDRFTLASQVNEIHCCLFSVMFCLLV